MAAIITPATANSGLNIDRPDANQAIYRSFFQILARIHYGWYNRYYQTVTSGDIDEFKDIQTSLRDNLQAAIYANDLNVAPEPFKDLENSIIDKIDSEV